ncbi:MAG: hypothetical protein WB783_15055 [Arenicellales bacterium]
MSLCEPIIVGPVSVLSATLRVQGQNVGATVAVHALGANPRVVAQGAAVASDQRFALSAGASLAVGDILVAVQQQVSDSSALPAGDLGVAVAPVPATAAQIAKVGLKTHLWVCGRFVWVDGAIPGAEVEMVGYGSGVANEGIARLELSHPLAGGAAVTVHQTIPGVGHGGNINVTPDPVPTTFRHRLPAPTMAKPLRACDPSVLVSDVLDGTLVTIHHADGSEQSAGFDRNALWFILGTPLAQGDKLTVRQEFQGNGQCAKFEPITSSPPLPVKSAAPVAAPVVEAPLCEGTTRVGLSNLRPGATVTIEANGTTYTGTVPPEYTEYAFGVEPLTGGTVRATQTICGVTSHHSKAVPVDPLKADVPSPSVVGPLYNCARSVSVSGAHLGATLQIWSKHAYGEGPISNLVTVHATQVTIDVAPYLHTGDSVYAVQWACASVGTTSASVKVVASPALQPPQVLECFAGDRMVYVRKAVPGALVEVYVTAPGQTTTYAGHAVATTLHAVTPVPIGIALRTGDTVSAHQRLCSLVSKPSPAVGVSTLDEWLRSHAAVGSSIVWEDASGAHEWPTWNAARKTKLDRAFAVARSGGAIPVKKVPHNAATLTDSEGVIEVLAPADAWAYFASSVAQSLALETSEQLGWSVTTYDAARLAQLFDSRRMFSWVTSPVQGYEIIGGTAGNVTPAPPLYSLELARSRGMIGATGLVTIANAIEWIHEMFTHFPGGTDTANMVAVWQYRGLAPMVRTVEGTISTSADGGGTPWFGHWTAGCWGTTGFLIALLRAINLPVKLVTNAGHAQPWFMSDSVYLSHGDDPYNGLTWAVPAVPPAEILTDEATFNAWFGPGVPDAQKAANIGRRTLDIAIQYLSNYILRDYCSDQAAMKSHANGQVAAHFTQTYDVAYLESQQLWSRMDAKIAALGGCGDIPYP